jgi:hypothetical protein
LARNSSATRRCGEVLSDVSTAFGPTYAETSYKLDIQSKKRAEVKDLERTTIGNFHMPQRKLCCGSHDATTFIQQTDGQDDGFHQESIEDSNGAATTIYSRIFCSAYYGGGGYPKQLPCTQSARQAFPSRCSGGNCHFSCRYLYSAVLALGPRQTETSSAHGKCSGREAAAQKAENWLARQPCKNFKFT